MSWQLWLAFFGASWVISLSPGAGAIASMSTGLRHGFLRGYWNILGLQLALLLQVAIVAAGVGALLAGSTTAFLIVKWFGVAYLAYLGVRQWRSAPTLTGTDIEPAPDPSLSTATALVLRAFLINTSNPKAIVFMLAVLPQFLEPAAALVPQYAVMAATMVAVDTVVMTGYTGLASRVLRLLRSPHQQHVVNRVFATLFFAAAAALATAV